MANREVWTVRGVAPGARKLAKSEAAKMGWTLGQWVEQAIERSARLGETEEGEKKSPTIREVVEGKAPDWSMNPVAVAAGHVAEEPELTIENLRTGRAQFEPPASSPVEKEEKPKGRKPRVVCQHGIEKGWNCWQCGGLAVIR